MSELLDDADGAVGAVSVESVVPLVSLDWPGPWWQCGASAGGVPVDGSAGAVDAGGCVVVGSVWALASDMPPAPSRPTRKAPAASLAGWKFMGFTSSSCGSGPIRHVGGKGSL